MTNSPQIRQNGGLTYGIAGLLSLLYMWCISLTGFRQTGLQFVAPLLIIFIAHAAWCFFAFGPAKNIFVHICRRTFLTTIVLLIGVILCTVLIPEPAHSNSSSNFVENSAVVMICLAMIAFVLAIIGAGLYLLVVVLRRIYRAFVQRPDDDDNNGNKVHEISSVLLTLGILLAASLEGVNGAYSFNSVSRSSTTQLINANQDHVWEALNTATNPEFPLPAVLAVFPRPIDVVVDEGVALNANRSVKFKGREGEGFLDLRVVERTPMHALFRVLSDTEQLLLPWML